MSAMNIEHWKFDPTHTRKKWKSFARSVVRLFRFCSCNHSIQWWCFELEEMRIFRLRYFTTAIFDWISILCRLETPTAFGICGVIWRVANANFRLKMNDFWFFVTDCSISQMIPSDFYSVINRMQTIMCIVIYGQIDNFYALHKDAKMEVKSKMHFVYSSKNGKIQKKNPFNRSNRWKLAC